MKIDFYLPTLGRSVNPKNRKNVSLQVNHDQSAVIENGGATVSLNNFYFTREDVKALREYIAQKGLTEGIPLEIRLKERGITETIKMYIDLMEGFKNSPDGLECAVKMFGSKDWMDDVLDGFTLESMYNEPNVATFTIDSIQYTSYKDYFDRKCIYIPYVISSVPNYQDAFMAIFGMTYIANELYKTVKALIQWSTPSAGLGAVAHVAQLITEIAYALLLIATLIALLNQLINCLIQPVKYHGAMLMSDMLKVVAVKIGLQAQSSIWDSYPFNQVAYLPEKYNPFKTSSSVFSLLGFNVGGYSSNGFTSPAPGVQRGYYNGTGGDFIRFLNSICNGKATVTNDNTALTVERKDSYPASTLFKLEGIRQDWNGYNTDELTANILIAFLNDPNEKNCANDTYIGTRLEATHMQVSTSDVSLVMLKGLREYIINAGRGVRKKELTFLEKVIRDIEQVWEFVRTVAFTPAEALINGAIGYLNTYLIPLINSLIAVWNALIAIVRAIIDVIYSIIDAIASLFGGDGPGHFTGINISIPTLPHIPHITLGSPLPNDFSQRVGALLLESDFLDIPKLLFVDTSRSEFTSQRIAYLHTDNSNVIHAQYLYDKFYYIESFAGSTDHNRFTKINPSLNSESDHNLFPLSLSNFKKLVENRKFKDNWGEEVIADSIVWNIYNQTAEFAFRKKGWLRQPQSPVASKRLQEINNNLTIQISLPNGQ